MSPLREVVCPPTHRNLRRNLLGCGNTMTPLTMIVVYFSGTADSGQSDRRLAGRGLAQRVEVAYFIMNTVYSAVSELQRSSVHAWGLLSALKVVTCPPTHGDIRRNSRNRDSPIDVSLATV